MIAYRENHRIAVQNYMNISIFIDKINPISFTMFLLKMFIRFFNSTLFSIYSIQKENRTVLIAPEEAEKQTPYDGNK